MTYAECPKCRTHMELVGGLLPKHRTPWREECTNYGKHTPPRVLNAGSPGLGKRA